MKKLILILTLTSGFAFASFAQNAPKTPEKRAAHQTRMLQKNLNLSEQQAAQINSILYQRALKMDSLKNNLSATDKRLNHLSKRSITLKTDDQINALLNPEQQKSYQAFKEMRKEKAASKKQPATQPTTQG